jgi:D-alanyl-D-alanine carboxypeptidase (penicillin-binding protein 5/6)
MGRRLAALALLLASITAPARGAENLFPGVAAAYLVRVQDRTLWAGDPGRRLAPASLTKIMAALLVLESYRPRDVVTVSRAAAAQTGARLGLKAGERMTVADLLAAALLRSANDACHALAEWRAGSQIAFVALMNQRAAELGLHDTRFANACGHDAPEHYSTAADLAALAEAALRHPEFARLVAQVSASVSTADGTRRFRLENTNALIGRLPGAVGVKSGYTRGAGKCLVAVAEREGMRVLLVLLDARNRWWDAHGIIEHAFAAARRTP